VHGIVGIHDGFWIVGVAKTQRVAELVERHAINVGVSADVPGFGFIKMHVAGDRLGVRRRGIKSVGENGGIGERKPVAVRAGRE
jgi:hypothetical protein